MKARLSIFLFLLFSCGGQKQKLQSRHNQVFPSEAKTETPRESDAKESISFEVARIDRKITSRMNGTISANSPVVVAGQHVKKGQLLLLFDNTNAFLEIRSEKNQLKSSLVQLQGSVLPQDSSIFNAFMNQINPNAILPHFPHFSLTTLQLLNQNQLLDRYDGIAGQEAKMIDYFVFAPVSGRLLTVPSKNAINTNEILFTIDENHYETSVVVPGEKGEAIEFRDEKGNSFSATIVQQLKTGTVLTGKLKEKSRFTLDQ